MSLLRASIHSLVQTAARLGLGLLNVKIAAIYLGPVGVGLYGQFWSLFSVFSGPLVAPIATVLTREIARIDDTAKRQQLVGEAIRLSFLIGVFLTALTIPWAGEISVWLFHSREYALQVVFAALALLPVFFNTTFIATARGTRRLKSLTVSELLIALSGTISAVIMIPLWGIHGAFWSLALSATLASLLLLVQYRNSGWLAQFLSLRSDENFRRNFLHFFASSIITATTIAVVPILLRNAIASQLDLEHVGYWQAGTRLADLYFSVFSALFAMHYLPRFAEIHSRKEMRSELQRGGTRIIPVVMVGALLIYFLLDLLIPLLYTAEFLPLKQIMGWQLAGVVMQATAWYIRYVVVAKGFTWWVAATDIGFSLMWLGMAVVLLPFFGLAAVSMAYCLRYVLDTLYSIVKCRQVIIGLPNA
ncbi:oligosaccharide flippase family protein [Dechloromonas denitrificans]|uniref:oligosaccharide flippase family protein n=1 Tax=Dechloromonas denitrificans TaxID=281362 RepID=UPI001CF8FA67|nr:oligosaccharide flippase family protein [Dechloromonas denitrificans]UCV05491.1 oligosaccharide flippase family protein [Dechloromonas denitrificans]UCV09837.1 oligosaccharide flippase family protein [Dechloromonas denitrificans]